MFPEQFFRVCVQAHLYLVQGSLVLNYRTSIFDFEMNRCVPVHPLLVGNLEEFAHKTSCPLAATAFQLPDTYVVNSMFDPYRGYPSLQKVIPAEFVVYSCCHPVL